MIRFSQLNFLFSAALAISVVAHTGCSKGMPGLLRAPVLGKSLRADMESTLRPEAEFEQAGGWLTSWELAHRESLRTGKPIMALFTGSDWCGPCIALKKKVLKTDQFGQWAADNVVLLELDFPKNTNQSPALEDQNRQLAKRFNVVGYPTVLVIEPSGKVIGKLGHSTNPDVWIKRAAGIVGS